MDANAIMQGASSTLNSVAKIFGDQLRQKEEDKKHYEELAVQDAINQSNSFRQAAAQAAASVGDNSTIGLLQTPLNTPQPAPKNNIGSDAASISSNAASAMIGAMFPGANKTSNATESKGDTSGQGNEEISQIEAPTSETTPEVVETNLPKDAKTAPNGAVSASSAITSTKKSEVIPGKEDGGRLKKKFNPRDFKRK